MSTLIQPGRSVCVIGAGTMGSGIAAHLANIGFEVTLLDVTQESVNEAFERAKRARPPHFYVPETANTIRLGSIRENMEWVREADWVCEAVVEKIDVKRDLFQTLENHLRSDAMISTNTSGLQIGLLAEGRSESFQKRFIGTHFFNPPRYLKLLELIPTEQTDPEVVSLMAKFLEEHVARRVVIAKDTPGFIANRFGMWSMFQATHAAEKLQLSVEQVDLITGTFLGRPRSGSFRLNDLVGLDIMRDIARNIIERCPKDPFLSSLSLPSSIQALLERGWIGDKAGQGYYRKEGKELVALDLQTMAYREKQEPKLKTIDELAKKPLQERLEQALEMNDEVGYYLREYLIPTLRYADYLKEEISHSVQDFDRVMKWGFGWEVGPFQMIDFIGAERVGVTGGEFYRGGTQRSFINTYISTKNEPEYLPLTAYPLIKQGEGFNLRDLGDGAIAICLSTKMGTLNPAVVSGMLNLLRTGNFKRVLLTSEARSFSAGYDLGTFLNYIGEEQWDLIEQALNDLQSLGSFLSTLPSVAAIFGHCLGGGLELAMHCTHIAAHAEAQIGLPESRVGLLPAGGGTTLMRLRHQEGVKALVEVAKTLSLGTISSNAEEARRLGYLRPTDVTVYHPDKLITEARQLLLQAKPIAEKQWSPIEGPFIGMIDKILDEMKAKGDLTEYDTQIGIKLRQVFARASTPEDALRIERDEFIELLKHKLTQVRMKHMLETGKPLRN